MHASRFLAALSLVVALASPAWAVRILKQSTTYNAQVFMTDASDHIAGKSGLTLTITASKDGAAFASITPTVTDLGSGWYKLALTTSHTDTVGDLALHVTGTGADASDLLLQVRPQVFGDPLYRQNHWYVATAGNGGSNSNNGRSWQTPFLTIDAATSAAKEGDKVHVGAGTFTITAGLTLKSGITYEGVDQSATTINQSTANAYIFDDQFGTIHDVTVRRMRLIVAASTTGGSAFYINGGRGWTIEDVQANGGIDGIFVSDSWGLVLRRVLAFSPWDGAYIAGHNFLIEDSTFYSQATYNTTDQDFCGLMIVAPDGDTVTTTRGTGVVRNTFAWVTRPASGAGSTSAGNKNTIALQAGGDVVLESVQAVAQALNASYAGPVYALADCPRFSARGQIFLRGTTAYSASAGGGTVRDFHSSQAGTVARSLASKINASKVGGSGTFTVDGADAATVWANATRSLTDKAGFGLASGAITSSTFGVGAIDASAVATGAIVNGTELSGITLPTNFSSLAITGGGAVTAGTVGDKTGYGLANAAITASKFDGSTAFAQTGDAYGAIVPKLPSNSAKIAGEGATAKNLDQVTGGGGSTVAAAIVDDSRTWFADGYRARNVVEVASGSAVTLACKPKINPSTTIASVSSVSVSGPEGGTPQTITPTGFTVNRSKTIGHADFPTLSVTGTYTVTWTITTVDGQTIVTVCKLIVR